MGEGNNFASLCTTIHSGVPTLAGGTYPGFLGEPTWGKSLLWPEGTYIG